MGALAKKGAPKGVVPHLKSSFCRPQRGAARGGLPPLVTLLFYSISCGSSMILAIVENPPM